MHVLIHTSPVRNWYVSEYLIPSLQSQNVEQISVSCDHDRSGILQAWLNSTDSLPSSGHTWHLQDDVLLCNDFKKYASSFDTFDGIVCGICTRYDGDAKDFYNVASNDFIKMWFSFPCIRIPNIVAKSCAHHIRHVKTNMYDKYKARGTGDDVCFRKYIRNCIPSIQFINANPNLVDHVDYLIGGSSSPFKQANSKPAPSLYFDSEVTEQLKQKLILAKK